MVAKSEVKPIGEASGVAEPARDATRTPILGSPAAHPGLVPGLQNVEGLPITQPAATGRRAGERPIHSVNGTEISTIAQEVFSKVQQLPVEGVGKQHGEGFAEAGEPGQHDAVVDGIAAQQMKSRQSIAGEQRVAAGVRIPTWLLSDEALQGGTTSALVVAQRRGTGSGEKEDSERIGAGKIPEGAANAGGKDGGGSPPENIPAAPDGDDERRIDGKQKIRNIFEDQNQPLDRSEEAEQSLERQIADRLETVIRDLPPGTSITNAAELAGIALVEESIAQLALDKASSERLIFTLPDKDPIVIRNEANPDIPLGEQAERAIRLAIDSGVLELTAQLPNVRQWAEDYHMTLGQAFRMQKNLVDAGLIIGIPGRGTFVAERHLSGEQRVPARTQIIQHIIRQIATGRLKSGDRAPSSNDLAAQFATGPSNVEKAIIGPELQSFFVIRDNRRVVAEISPIRQINLFLQAYMQQEGKTVDEIRSSQEVTAFLREYTQTRESGEQFPSQLKVAKMLGLSTRPVQNAYSQLQQEGLIISDHRRTRIAGEYETDAQRIEAYIRARLDSLPPEETFPSLRTLFYELGTLKGRRPVAIHSDEQIAALLREYIKFLEAGTTLPSQIELAEIVGTSTFPIQSAYRQLHSEGLIDTDHAGTRVAGEYETDAQHVESDLRKLLSRLQIDERLPSQRQLAHQLGTNLSMIQRIMEKFGRENLTYTNIYTYATGVAYEEQTLDEDD